MIIRLLSVLFVLALPCFSQEIEQDTLVPPSSDIRLEFPDGKYIPVPRKEQDTSPAYRFSRPGIFTVQVNVTDNGENILGDAANEPSIAVDPTDPARMVIGWRQFDTISSSFRQAGWGYTTDGGQTWTFPGVIEPGVFRSDPVLDSDSKGNFYYLSWTYRTDDVCDVFKSIDGGVTWDSGTFAWGGDKPWMVIDKTGGIGEGNIYASWTGGHSICYPKSFTRSTDGGVSFEECVAIPYDPIYGTLAVGPDGELYACGISWGNGKPFIVAKSSTAKDPSQNVSWDFSTIVDLDGTFNSGGGLNPRGLLGQVWVAVDTSNGETRGNVYLLCSVQRSSSYDPLDIMFARSTDGGITWGSPVRVNDDTSSRAWQWFGTISVAPKGRIDVIWLDTRDDPDPIHSIQSSLYYAYSTDAGVSWSENERLSDAFDSRIGWPQDNKLGDYFDMVSDMTGVHLAWAATFNGEQDVYYSYISAPPPCEISITTPKGGESFCVDDIVDITWASQNASGTVKIDYSTDGGSNWKEVITSTLDNGTYSWTIPNTPSVDCLVRICDVENTNCCGQSDAVFKISGCGPLAIVTESLPDGRDDCPYAEPIIVTGGILPYTWSVLSGDVPSGLELDGETGMVSGRPDAVDTYCFTVEVRDDEGSTASQEYCIDIGAYTHVKGDANTDCVINVLDVLYIVNSVLGWIELTPTQEWCADCDGPQNVCDGNGVVNIVDTVKIVRILLELEECP